MSEHPNSYDVIIIGGGIIGVCSAYYLWREGYQVAILEKGALGSGSSFGNAGLIVPSHFIPLAAPGVIGQGLRWMFNPESPFYIKPRFDLTLFDWLWKFRAACTETHVNRSIPLLRDMHLASLALFEDLAALAELDFGFEQRGLLMLYNKEAGKNECLELVEIAHQINLEAKMLNFDQVQAKLPGLDGPARGGAYFPQDAQLNPANFVSQLGQYLARNGVQILTQTEVQNIEIAEAKTIAVRTPRGEFTAGEIVLAGGAWSPNIVRSLPLKLPIQAAKGYSFTVPQLAGKLEVPLLLTEAKIAVTPLQEGIRFAGTLELVGIDLSINRRRVQAIRRAIPEYLGNLALPPLEQVETWAGLRPCSPDGLPIIGRTPRFHNLTIAAGHAMVGVSLAPITGKLIAEIISNQSPSFDLSLLTVARFN
jgi:D-amino-acid dehydrogenase